MLMPHLKGLPLLTAVEMSVLTKISDYKFHIKLEIILSRSNFSHLSLFSTGTRVAIDTIRHFELRRAELRMISASALFRSRQPAIAEAATSHAASYLTVRPHLTTLTAPPG